MNIEKIFWKFFKYFFLGLFALIIILFIFWDGGDQANNNNGFYSLSSSSTLSSDHPSYKTGYRYSCLYKHTETKKYMDWYSKEKCPKTRR